MSSITAKLELIKSLFKCRNDVFAVHWQRGSKGGYMPAFSYDPYMYRLHKIKGGTFKDFKEKTYLPLTDQQIIKHLNGEQLIGVYPLLKDNTSWFIVVDFDEKNWEYECMKFIEICSENTIPAYLERSRSGKGGHVWIFFEQHLPASRSRKIITALLERSGILSVFDKSSSFDRLFPNQDFLSGKGLGNLIALPFYKPAFDKGNSCFVDDGMTPYTDQWDFLSKIQRLTVRDMDHLYKSLVANSNDEFVNNFSGKIEISLQSDVRISKTGLNLDLMSYLKEELNVSNSEFFVKKKTGKATWRTPRYFRCIKETEHQVIIPRGFIGKLIRYCKQQRVDFEFKDKRSKQSPINFTTSVSLRQHQKVAIDAAKRKDFGIISAPPGSGKTIIGLQIIADKKQPALIIVHRKQLLEQWLERIETFLGIPKKQIGKIGQGKAKLGEAVTVAMIQSLVKQLEKDQDQKIVEGVGTVIIDECHHVAAETFRQTISELKPYYQYGLTATPFRKGTDGKLINIYLGEIIAEIESSAIASYRQPRIVVRNTSFDIPFNPKTDTFETLSKILIHDSSRNKLILNDVISELNRGKRIVIITERNEHIEALNQFLKQSFETITLNGEDSEMNRKAKCRLLIEGNYQVLITTGQFFGEGSDLHNASCLFLAYPFSFKGKLIQYIGRVQRSEIAPTIYDYRDIQIEYLDRLFLKRNIHYRNIDKQKGLFDDEIGKINTSKYLKIEKKLKIPISDLDFRYGTVAFNYLIPEVEGRFEFEIENDNLRPEFDVLKGYFAKVLKSKFVEVEIHVEFRDKVLIALSAYSSDIERIDQEVIESVKIRFLDKEIIDKTYSVGDSLENLLDLKQLQETSGAMFNSEEDLLLELLMQNKYKHSRQLIFLASRHDLRRMKLRFVLKPFSFVFLLSGKQEYHMVLETLDTEEATFIWHFDKKAIPIRQMMIDLNKDINLIRNKGRQAFLVKPPNNFCRILHDYSDQKKGFVIWKDQLEEQLI